MKREEEFTSRWGLIISTLGVAVGTGNIWRFSRIVAQNGGGSFLIPWVIFLLIWSVPLIIAEFALGKFTRYGPIGAISKTAGKKFGWMGAYIAFVSTAIMFYYSVVTGWCIKYFAMALTGKLLEARNLMALWKDFASGYQPVLFHFISMVIAAYIIYRGIVNGIEKANKFLVVSLVVILILLLVRAVTLPNAQEGLKYLFTPKLKYLLSFKVWLNALTQNAWDTGAGWGLILTYAIYMRKKEDVPLNAALIGFGNNSISLIAGIIIFSTVFSLAGADAMSKISASGPANTGLTFIYLPLLFGRVSSIPVVNRIFEILFFFALSSAAMSSLISLVELTTRTLIDFGVKRKKAILFVASAGFLLGVPSALNMDFFTNQDWVWGVGLILSGAFISFSIIRFGVKRFQTEVINGIGNDIKVGRFYNFIISVLIPLQVIVLLVWWLGSSVEWDPMWWNPFHIENAGTALFQWSIAIVFFIVFNKFIVKKTLNN